MATLWKFRKKEVESWLQSTVCTPTKLILPTDDWLCIDLYTCMYVWVIHIVKYMCVYRCNANASAVYACKLPLQARSICVCVCVCVEVRKLWIQIWQSLYYAIQIWCILYLKLYSYSLEFAWNGKKKKTWPVILYWFYD